MALVFATCLMMAPLLSTIAPRGKDPASGSPGDIGLFVQDATRAADRDGICLRGGATQDPADKPGVGNLVADLLDEGSGELDSKTFHEHLDRRAIELSFSSTRDYFRGSLRMLKDNKDEAFDCS